MANGRIPNYNTRVFVDTSGSTTVHLDDRYLRISLVVIVVKVNLFYTLIEKLSSGACYVKRFRVLRWSSPQ